MKVTEPQTGYATLVLVVLIMVILFLFGGLDFSIPPDEKENATLPSCGFCIRDCQARLAKSLEACREGCVGGVDCEELPL